MHPFQPAKLRKINYTAKEFDKKLRPYWLLPQYFRQDCLFRKKASAKRFIYIPYAYKPHKSYPAIVDKELCDNIEHTVSNQLLPVIAFQLVKNDYRFSVIFFRASSAKRAMFHPAKSFRKTWKQSFLRTFQSTPSRRSPNRSMTKP